MESQRHVGCALGYTKLRPPVFGCSDRSLRHSEPPPKSQSSFVGRLSQASLAIGTRATSCPWSSVTQPEKPT
jgi:hypothetical protein